ncbi:MAG: hypothetical protein WC568_10440 [Candidatus Methanoperedens sp.]
MTFLRKIFLKTFLLVLIVSIILTMSSASGPMPDTHEDFPSWSPDGKKILFSSYGPNVEGIFIANPDGSDLQQKMSSGESVPSWFPDGTKIIFVKNFYNGTDVRNGSYDIGTLDLKTDIITRLTFNGNELKENVPTYSPDGKYVVFEASKNSYLINSNGSDPRLIARNAWWPKWSPDGKMIAFYSLDTNYISVTNSDGSDKKQVYVNYFIQNVRWTPDSKYLLLNNGTNIITKVNVTDPTDVEYIYDPVAHWRPVYSHDGNFVAFISDMDGGNPDLFVARSNGSDIYRIVFNTNPGASDSPEYFGKKSRPVPPPWPTPSPTAVKTPTATPTSTPTAITTATQTPSVPGFSLLVALASISILVLIRRIKR